MSAASLDAFVVPSTDPHQGEYVPEHFHARGFLSGFHGSAGTVVVTQDTAGLWTDGRYFLPAEEALRGSDIALFRLHTPGVPDYPQWLADTLPRNATVGVDARLVTMGWHETMVRTLAPRGIELRATEDPFAEIWRERPPVPREAVDVHEREYAGEAVGERLARLREAMKDAGAAGHFVSTLDDIAWILNLRGSDVAYNPVFLSWLLVEPRRARLYAGITRLKPAALEQLGEAGVTVHPYEQALEDLARLEGPVLVDPERTSWAAGTALHSPPVLRTPQPSTAMKACKNSGELDHIRGAMVRDGVVMVRFLRWIEDLARDPGKLAGHTELTAAHMLQELRGEDPLYVCESFDAISGINGNGAVIHYRVEESSAAPLSAPAVYLIDCGGQYRDGTTDITRTIALGDPTGDTLAEEHRHLRSDYTRVLQGHIALATLRFPEGTSGREIDVVARRPLWDAHRNYGHGTGHGVGYFLNVHEGPQRIAPAGTDYPLEPGMIISNEPGLYRPGRYGIRIENLVAVQRATPDDPQNNQQSDQHTSPQEGQTEIIDDEFGGFLSFETLSLCPLDRRLIDAALLSAGERQWIDGYHQQVRAALSPHLSEMDRRWLEGATAPL